MPMAHAEEITKNFDFFAQIVPSLIEGHSGQVALIKSCEIVGYFHSPAEAIKVGTEKYGALPFSVQRVIDRPIDIGFLSHAASHGIAV